TDRIQLKDTITSLRIQLDGLKVENVSLKRRYDELSKANTHSRTAYTEKLSALTSKNTKLKALVHVVPADYVSAGHVLVPAGSSSSVPADYVSAGHVLVPADRDRIR
ncbi:hypothetical protein Tco_0239316, partial [Tanacetum coccineum]